MLGSGYNRGMSWLTRASGVIAQRGDTMGDKGGKKDKEKSKKQAKTKQAQKAKKKQEVQPKTNP